MQIMNNYFRALAGMVYMMTNNEVMNQIIAFYRDMNGMLTLWVPTQLMVEVLVQARSLLQQQTMASTP
jgi:hypothetical protein